MSGFEIIGVVAASGQFLEQGMRVVRLIDSVIDKVKNAPDELKALRGHIGTLNAIAQDVERSMRSQGGRDQDREREIAAVLGRCRAYTVELEGVLQSFDFEHSDRLGHKTQRAILALVREPDVVEILKNIEREKSSLHLLVYRADA